MADELQNEAELGPDCRILQQIVTMLTATA